MIPSTTAEEEFALYFARRLPVYINYNLYIFFAHVPQTRTTHSRRNDIYNNIMIYSDNEACQRLGLSTHLSLVLESPLLQVGFTECRGVGCTAAGAAVAAELFRPQSYKFNTLIS